MERRCATAISLSLLHNNHHRKPSAIAIGTLGEKFVLKSSSSQPSNLVHSLSYQHPLYYHWQAPFLNPQMES
ncbi:hypothetical protein RGQ29_005246 [Quercus rubra]|uniref:Uncharacterized protein n=1 Tax=Quercus rubra TaxID=3512 RepID=A0AAN7IAA3_QUERU|nr:hypothetical protein RGQ29_005246 [Quercus rubra]